VPIFWLAVEAFSLASRMASVSLPLERLLQIADADSTSERTSSGTFSEFLRQELLGRVERGCRPELRTSASSRRLRSSSAYCSASRTILSMSSLASAEPPEMVTGLLLAGAQVLGRHIDDCRWRRCRRRPRPAARPRGAGGDAGQLEHAELLVVRRDLTLAPEHLDLATDGWLSSAVVKISDRLVGIVVFRSMSLVKMPPLVSMPQRQRGHVEQQDVLDPRP